MGGKTPLPSWIPSLAQRLPPSHGILCLWAPHQPSAYPLRKPSCPCHSTRKLIFCVYTFKYHCDVLLLANVHCDSWYPLTFTECPACTCGHFKALYVLVHLIRCERTDPLYLKQDLSWIYHFLSKANTDHVNIELLWGWRTNG